jgi:predicted secreted protein
VFFPFVPKKEEGVKTPFFLTHSVPSLKPQSMKTQSWPMWAFACFSMCALGQAGCTHRPISGSWENAQNDTTTMHVKVGEPFALVLEAQMGTGFQWIMEGELPEGLVFLQKEQLTKEDAKNADLQRFRYRADEKGRFVLTFMYRRPWEKKINPDTRKTVFIILAE